MKKYYQQSGAALIMTVLIISIFSVATLAVGRVLTSEIRLGADYGNQETAFWAAEAGIERGLLYLRENTTPELPIRANYDSNQYRQTNLTNNNSSIVNEIKTKEGDGDIYNYLKIYDEVLLKDTEYILEKDQGLTLRPTSPAILNIKWYLLDRDGDRVTGSINCDRNRLYWRKSRANGTFETETFPSPGPHCLQGRVMSLSFSANDELVQFKAFTQDNYKIKLKISVADGQTLIGGRYIYIESIGSYNNTNKKILAKIDREDIMAPNIMDYVIFSEGDIR